MRSHPDRFYGNAGLEYSAPVSPFGGNGDFSPLDSERWNLELRGRGTLHFKTAHLNHQRLKFGLIGNSTKGSLRFSSDPNHLFKVTPRVTGSNQQGRVELRSSRPAGSRQLSGPTWWPAICAIAGRTRPLATTSRRIWAWHKRPPPRAEARGGGARHRKEEVRARGGGAHLYRPPPSTASRAGLGKSG